MSVVYNKKTRRQFLVGAGNTMLALPFLPSLFSSQAQAQVAANANKKMMIFWLDHNPLREYWPNRNIATTAVGSIGARETMLSSLPSMASVSSILSNPFYNTLRMQNQITMVRGMDVANSHGGHGFGPMGGFCEFNSGPIVQSANNYPTFDQYIENSPTLYPASTPSNVTRAIRIGFQGGPSYISKTGNLTQVQPHYGYDAFYPVNEAYFNILVMYNEVFRGLTGTNPPSPMADPTNQMKTNILNRVQEAFTSFRTNRRVSSDDIARVDQHLGFLADLQRSFATVVTPAPVSCSRPTAPVVTRDPSVFLPRYMDLLVLAFKCGLTKFSAMYFEAHDPRWIPNLNVPAGADMHGAIHGVGAENNPAVAQLKGHVYETYMRYYLNIVADRFLAPMNEMEGSTGRTYLDNMTTVILSQMGMESANTTSSHGSGDMQQMLIGSMGGAIRAGRYVALPEATVQGFPHRLPYNTFLITLLHLMGVPPSEYNRFSSNGQGYGYYSTYNGNPLTARFNSPITEILT